MSQTDLVTELTSRGVTDVYVCGLAYDICVGKSCASVIRSNCAGYMYALYRFTLWLLCFHHRYRM